MIDRSGIAKQKEDPGHTQATVVYSIMRHTHKYVLAGGRKRERLASVGLLHGLLQREFIARLDLARSEERRNVGVGGLSSARSKVGDDGSHVSLLLLSFWGLARFGNCARGKWPKSVSQSVTVAAV